MKTIGSSETWYLPTIYIVYNTKNTVTGIDQLAFYSKTILHLPKLRSTNGNDPEGDLDLFQEISIRLDGTENPRKHRQDKRQPGQTQQYKRAAFTLHQSTLYTHNNTRQSVFPFTLKTDAEGCSERW
jgi:hypothetical protein